MSPHLSPHPPPPLPPPSPSALQQVAGLRPALLAHASRQVREPSLAQDLVQDTLEAALRGLQSFEGRSSVSTWVFAILRNRIADHHRRPRTLLPLSAVLGVDDDEAPADALDHLLQAQGQWHADAPAGTPATPEASLVRRQFWAQVEHGVASLSAAQARVFRLRDLLDQDAAHVSAALGITPNQCHVTLHRARARLREVMRAPAGTQAAVAPGPR